MTTEVLTKLSPSPPLTGESCECRQCVERSVSPKARTKSTSPVATQICSKSHVTTSSSSAAAEAAAAGQYSDNMDKDLDELIYSLIMLIVEGRTFNDVSTRADSLHAKPLINNLIKKVLYLNQMATVTSKAVTDSKYLIPVKMAPGIGASTQSEHVCSNPVNTQVSTSALYFFDSFYVLTQGIFK